MRKDINNLHLALILTFLIIFIGVTGFMSIEGYTFLEAFYMTLITMSTVGFGEVRNLSSEGMLFTAFLIIFSFGVFGYAVTSITRYILDGEFENYFKKYRVSKRIKRFDQHVIVCGYGRNGKQSTAELLSHAEKVIVIERDEELIDEVDGNNPNLVYIYGDATDEDVLNKANVSTARALITTLPSDADNLFVVLTARELNPGMTIISRASEDRSDIKLKRAGATNVIMPDKVGGIRMAKLVSQPDVIEFVESILLRTGNAVNLEEIACKDMRTCFINKTIGELNIRKISGANLIGLKTEKGDYIFNPSPDITLKSSDKLFALGTPSQISRLIQEMTRE